MLDKVSTSFGTFLAPKLDVDVPEGRVQQHLSMGGRLRVVDVRHLSAEVYRPSARLSRAGLLDFETCGVSTHNICVLQEGGFINRQHLDTLLWPGIV